MGRVLETRGFVRLLPLADSPTVDSMTFVFHASQLRTHVTSFASSVLCFTASSPFVVYLLLGLRLNRDTWTQVLFSSYRFIGELKCVSTRDGNLHTSGVRTSSLIFINFQRAVTRTVNVYLLGNTTEPTR